MKKKLLMSLVLLSIIGASVVFAQQPTLDKLKFANNTSGGGVNVSPLNNNITGAVVIPATYEGKPVTRIESFQKITGITSVVIPDSVTYMRGFYGCSGLTSVTIGAGLTDLGSDHFRECTSLTSVTIPATMKEISQSAFGGCTNLTSVTFMGQTKLAGNNSFPGNDLRTKYNAANGGPGTYTRSAGGNTWTKQSSIAVTPAPAPANTSLNGVWEIGGLRITISGNTGTINALASSDPLWSDAINKGYVKVGDQYLRNLRSTGNLTWSGQSIGLYSNKSAPNVATSAGWGNCTITMSADGRTIDINTSGIWTRR